MAERGPADPERRLRRRDSGVKEPVGYVATQFLSAAGFVFGIGLAPDGLLLLAAALILSVIDLRRFRALNPGLLPETSEGFRHGVGRVLYRYSAATTAALIGLSIVAAALVQRDDLRADAIGPALAGGVIALVLNWQMKRAVVRTQESEGAAQRRPQEPRAVAPPEPRDDDADGGKR